MATYVTIDSLNTFMRARHSASRQADTWTKVGFAIHVTLASINAAVRNFGADHVIYAIEGRSWRRDVYPRYKNNRDEARAALTEREVDDDRLFFEAYLALTEFLREKTAVSVIGESNAEADDVIARFVLLHPNDKHVIISSDSDYLQLVSPTVWVFNGVEDQVYRLDGITTARGRPVVDKKTKEPKQMADPEWLLFEKCMRGDSGDYVFSAYPGVRLKSSKKQVGLLEAFEDRNKQGYAWNNLMLQKWTDHHDVEHRVLDDYQRNVMLIDLKAQPEPVKAAVDQAIVIGVSRDPVPQCGIHFMKFCGKYELNKLSENATEIAAWLSKPYTGPL